MKPGTCIRICSVIVLAAAVAGCGVIELAPDLPALRDARNDGSETSELVVIIDGGSLGYRAIWVIYVDGVARASLPTRPGFTRVSVTPGQHEVTVAFRTRDLNVVLMPLPPWSSEEKARKSVTCAERSRCGLKAGIYIDWQRSSLVVDAAVLEDTQLEMEINELPFVKPGR